MFNSTSTSSLSSSSMEKTPAGSNSEYLCVQVNPGTSIQTNDEHHNQTPDVVIIRNGVDSDIQHPRYVGHLKNQAAGSDVTDVVLWATVNEGALAANIILAQSTLHISRVLVGIAAVFFYCLDVYACSTRSSSDPSKSQHWDMVAVGLCVAGIILCLVDYALACRTPKWRFAAVGSTSSTDQPICIVVVNHHGSA